MDSHGLELGVARPEDVQAHRGMQEEPEVWLQEHPCLSLRKALAPAEGPFQ